MDYYGPWHDGPLTVERHDASTGITRTTEYPVANPAPSGWFIGGWKSYAVTESAGVGFPNGVSDPPTPIPDPSMTAWDEARSEPANTNQNGGSAIASIGQGGTLAYAGAGQGWRQTERWDLNGAFWKFAYSIPSNTSWIAAVTGPFEDWPEGAVTVEVENTGPQSAYWIELIEARIVGLDDTAFGLYYKAPNEVGQWFGDEASLPAASINDSATVLVPPESLSPAAPGLVIPVSDLSAFVAERVAGTITNPGDPRWPSGAVAHDSAWPGVYGPGTWERDAPTGAGSYGTVILKYRPPRWRYVYDRPLVPAIQQTTHRDDHLAGGAYQTWPAPTSRQTSNTTFGGYL